MKTLQEFLNANAVEGLTKEIAVSERIKDENGELYKFKIKTMTQKELDNLRAKSTTYGKGNKKIWDNAKFNSAVVINNTIYPNFKDAENLKKLGAVTPEDYLDKVLLAGEINRLSIEIMSFSGFNQDINELIEQAKN